MKSVVSFDVEKVRNDFPQIANNHDLVYLDNAATTFKPSRVIEAISTFYATDNANVHRGIHSLSQKATAKFEMTRNTVARFINANTSKEIVFTSGATESINLVAFSFGALLKPGDEILISNMEHHSNLVPWQQLCERKGCKLNVVAVNANGEIEDDDFDRLLNEQTKIVAITHVSNTLGTINPVKKIITKAHAYGAKVLIDGAQSVQHLCIDVQDLDCDFFVFSGHKLFGPTGIGILYGKEALLEKMPPYQTGGEMIADVSFQEIKFNEIPYKFEAGTPNIAGAIGLAEAILYFTQLDRNELLEYENTLLTHALDGLSQIKGMQVLGHASPQAPIISFNVQHVHPYDLGVLLDKQGFAVRTGHHCTQPLIDFFKIQGTVRCSLAFYNSKAEIEKFIQSVDKSVSMLRG